jgi:hypothetical protein
VAGDDEAAMKAPDHDGESSPASSSGRASFSEPSVRERLLADLHLRGDLVEVLKKKLDTCTLPDVLDEVATLLVNAGLFVDEEEAAGAAPLLTTSTETRVSPPPPGPEGSTASPQGGWKKASSLQKGGPGVVRQSSQPLLGRKARPASAQHEPVHVEVAHVDPAPVISLEARLRGLLEEPATSPDVVKFVAYLESCFAVENFNFLKDVAEYDAIPLAAKTKERKARKIYETYFVDSSPSMINMSHRAAAPVANRYGPLSPNLFALAVKAVKQNLQDDILVRYLELAKRDATGDDSETPKAAATAAAMVVNPRLNSRGSTSGIVVEKDKDEALASPPQSPSMAAAPYESLAVTTNPLLALNAAPAVPYESLNVVQNPLLLQKGRKQSAKSDSRDAK